MQEKNFQDENINLTVRSLDGCKMEFEAIASSPLMEKAKEDAVKAVAKSCSLPGFRKGKAPLALVKKKYGEAIKEEERKTLADLCFNAAQKLFPITVLHNASITFNLKSDNHLVFNFEREPEVPSIDPEKFKPTPHVVPPITEKEIEEAIRQMRFFYASWSQKQEPIEEGDYLILDVESLEVDPPEKAFSSTRFEVSKERMAKWMRDLVIGKKAGDIVEGISYPDEETSEEEKKEYRKTKVRLTILKVETALLPEINDDLAKKVGVQNVKEMNDSIEKMLKHNQEEKILGEEREEVNHFLLKEYPFEVPASILKNEFLHRKNRLLSEEKAKKEWNALPPDEKAKVEENLKRQADEALRLHYLSLKIIEEAKIRITKEEVEQEMSFASIDPKKAKEPEYTYILSKLALLKAQDYILEKSKAKVV